MNARVPICGTDLAVQLQRTPGLRKPPVSSSTVCHAAGLPHRQPLARRDQVLDELMVDPSSRSDHSRRSLHWRSSFHYYDWRSVSRGDRYHSSTLLSPGCRAARRNRVVRLSLRLLHVLGSICLCLVLRRRRQRSHPRAFRARTADRAICTGLTATRCSARHTKDRPAAKKSGILSIGAVGFW